MNPALIEVEDLSTTTADGQPLSAGVSFALHAGELVLIEGDNGAGKTTLARCLLGLHRRHRGRIRRHLPAREIAYLPQLGNVQFFLPLTLGDVIALKIPSCTADEITSVGLLDRASLERPWMTASGGERQRTLLTRLLLSDARLLILDEPFNHVDPATRDGISRALAARLKQGTAILMISHLPGLGELLPQQRLYLERRAEV
jgi:ABC-type Mn2+/Zn2+ transport system ATPase subunit